MTTQVRAADAAMVRFTIAAFEDLQKQVQSAPGRECCGALVHGAGERVERIVPMPNQAADPRHQYAISTRLLFELERSATVAGFYHSHPDGTSRPSRYDLEAAWPGYLYVIAGRTIRAWRLNPAGNTFHEVTLVVES